MAERKIRVGINGFGRRGRTICRIICWNDAFELVALNDPFMSAENMLYLLRHDSVHGGFSGVVKMTDEGMEIHNKPIAVYHCPSPIEIPWGRHDVDVVFECTGKYNSQIQCSSHIREGVQLVVIAAPPDDSTPILVEGVGDGPLPRLPIFSASSPTTLSIAPLLSLLDKQFGVQHVFFSSTHATTSIQHVTDGIYNDDQDLRLGRSVMNNAIPTSTGASICLPRLFPHLKGKIVAESVRVPLKNVSFLSITIQLCVDTTLEEVRNLLVEKCATDYKTVLFYTEEKVVSSDFINCSYSAVIDGELLQVCDSRFVHICCWYDNEWGFAKQTVDLVQKLLLANYASFVSIRI